MFSDSKNTPPRFSHAGLHGPQFIRAHVCGYWSSTMAANSPQHPLHQRSYLLDFIFCEKNMAGEVVVDALPYFDQGYDESGVKEAVCCYFILIE